MKRWKVPVLWLLSLILASVACGLPSWSSTETPDQSGIVSTSTQQESAPASSQTPVLLPPTEVPLDTPAPPTRKPLPPPEGTLIPHLRSGSPVTITNIDMLDAKLGWAIGGDQDPGDHVLRTVDGGATWTEVTPPEPIAPKGSPSKAAVGNFRDGQRAWVLYYLVDRDTPEVLTVWRTRDGGNSWEAGQRLQLEFLGTEAGPPKMVFGDDQHGWVMARYGGAGMHRYPVYLLRTSDGGSQWEKLVDPYESVYLQSCHKSGFDFNGASTGWVTVDQCPTAGVNLHRTSDGGVTWEERPLPSPSSAPDSFQEAFCEAHSPILLSTSSGALVVRCSQYDTQNEQKSFLYSSGDGGETWQTSPYPGGELQFLGEKTAWALGREIAQSKDGGRTWETVKEVFWDGQFSFVSDQTVWAVARAEGEIALVKSSDGCETWEQLEPVIAP